MVLNRYNVLPYLEKQGGYLDYHYKGSLVKYADHIVVVTKLLEENKLLKQALNKAKKF